jgi:hypothetical protein
VDIAVLANIFQRLCFIWVLHPEITEMDLNPLMVSSDTKSIVVDAPMIIKEVNRKWKIRRSLGWSI